MPTTFGPSVFDASLFIPELKTWRKDSVLAEMVARAARTGSIRGRDVLLETLLTRERVGGTAIGKSVALPNARSITVVESRLVFARSRRGIDWNALDEQPVHLVMLALSPAEVSEQHHLTFLTRVASAVRLSRNRQKLADAASFEDVVHLLKEVGA